jgi:ATP-dependent exoDNAse (exonuclease V) alpha subunit
MFTTGNLNEDRSMVEVISQDDEKIKFSIPTKLFTIYFNPAYCVTIHASQGMTIKENYTIHEFSKFDSRLKYVAISRAQSVDQLNFK